ncbi:hypothetical protein D3C80_2100330 [compost metagenome]
MALAQQADVLVDSALNGIQGVLGDRAWVHVLGDGRKLAGDAAKPVNDAASSLH